MIRLIAKILLFSSLLSPFETIFSYSSIEESTPSFVSARLWGRLGNHFFIIAAATCHALDHGALPIFPDLIDAFDPHWKIDGNYVRSTLQINFIHIFSKINTVDKNFTIEHVYREPVFSFSPIPYHRNMLLEGWFQSEKYFAHRKDEIIALFSPTAEIMNYLRDHYGDVLSNPKTVSLHLRSYHHENASLDAVYPTYGKEYCQKAMEYFGSDHHFIVFSDQIEWAKEQLKGINRNIRYIEGEEYYHDFYLMSLCKHNIITNSTFSWWAAYLNQNPEKVVLAPHQWFTKEYNRNTSDLIPKEWIILK